MALYLKNDKQLGVKTQEFIYCWTHVTTDMWYVSSYKKIINAFNKNSQYV